MYFDQTTSPILPVSSKHIAPKMQVAIITIRVMMNRWKDVIPRK
jgi:hypothetical protein